MSYEPIKYHQSFYYTIKIVFKIKSFYSVLVCYQLFHVVFSYKRILCKTKCFINKIKTPFEINIKYLFFFSFYRN